MRNILSACLSWGARSSVDARATEEPELVDVGIVRRSLPFLDRACPQFTSPLRDLAMMPISVVRSDVSCNNRGESVRASESLFETNSRSQCKLRHDAVIAVAARIVERRVGRRDRREPDASGRRLGRSHVGITLAPVGCRAVVEQCNITETTSRRGGSAAWSSH